MLCLQPLNRNPVRSPEQNASPCRATTTCSYFRGTLVSLNTKRHWVSLRLSGSLLALRNLPGSIRFMLSATIDKYNADYLIVDMSPSLGPVNQNLLMTSDHFVVPLHPDYFSQMALSSLTRVLPRWKSWADTARGIEVQAKLLNVDDFKARAGIDPWDPIMEVADFNSLITLSQEHQMPVYALTPEIVGKGAIWDQAKSNMDVFYKGFEECAEKVIALTS
jgi:hypothetical protein